jgi:hypothetical protein
VTKTDTLDEATATARLRAEALAWVRRFARDRHTAEDVVSDLFREWLYEDVRACTKCIAYPRHCIALVVRSFVRTLCALLVHPIYLLRRLSRYQVLRQSSSQFFHLIQRSASDSDRHSTHLACSVGLSTTRRIHSRSELRLQYDLPMSALNAR